MKFATGVAALLVSASACSQKAPAPSASPIVATRRLPSLADYRNGLSDADRRQMYHLSEGSEIIPLAILQALERPRTPQDAPGNAPSTSLRTGLVPFMENMERYGFITDDKHDRNPFELPVCMTVARARLTNRIVVGFNCTTCHVGELWLVQNGYGRADAFGVARTLLFGKNEKNLRPQNAPVSFPHMWGIETTAWLQWGANMNSVMERNIGQSLGVGAVFDADTYATTSRLDNLNKLEHLVYRLTPPDWPTQLFGAIDDAKATRGRDLYDRQCANCHEKPFEVTPSGLVVYQLFTLRETGTSPLVAQNFDEPVIVDGKEMRFAAAAFGALENLKKRYYTANSISDETQADWENRARRPPPAWKPTMRS